jgi:hypothetical protein
MSNVCARSGGGGGRFTGPGKMPNDMTLDVPVDTQSLAPKLDIDPFAHESLADPYPEHALLRESGPVVWLTRYGIWGMARHAEVKAALQDWQTFCSGRGVGLSDFAKETPWRSPSIILEADPPQHSRSRGVLGKVLSLPALMRLREQMERHAEDLLDDVLVDRSFDVYAALGAARAAGWPEHRLHYEFFAAQVVHAIRTALLTLSSRTPAERSPCQKIIPSSRRSVRPGWRSPSRANKACAGLVSRESYGGHPTTEIPIRRLMNGPRTTNSHHAARGPLVIAWCWIYRVPSASATVADERLQSRHGF